MCLSLRCTPASRLVTTHIVKQQHIFLLPIRPRSQPRRPANCPLPHAVASNTAGQASFAMNFLLLFSLVFTGFLVNVASIPSECDAMSCSAALQFGQGRPPAPLRSRTWERMQRVLRLARGRGLSRALLPQPPLTPATPLPSRLQRRCAGCTTSRCSIMPLKP